MRLTKNKPSISPKQQSNNNKKVEEIKIKQNKIKILYYIILRFLFTQSDNNNTKRCPKVKIKKQLIFDKNLENKNQTKKN